MSYIPSNSRFVSVALTSDLVYGKKVMKNPMLRYAYTPGILNPTSDANLYTVDVESYFSKYLSV